MDYIKHNWPLLLFLYLIVAFGSYVIFHHQPLILILSSIPGIAGIVRVAFGFSIIGSWIKDEADSNRIGVGRQLLKDARKSLLYLFLPAAIITSIIVVVAFILANN